MTVLRTAYVNVLAKTDQFEPDLNKKLSRIDSSRAGKQVAGSFSSGFTRALTAGLATAGVAGISGLVKSSISGASALSETVNKSNVIFGENAKVINTWAKGAAKNLGLSKAQALEAAAGFGNMFSQLGFAGDVATQMSQDVVKLSADLGSFNNLPTAQVSEMISAAFRGEYDSLQRLIPNISAARVEQEALAATGKKSTKELTAQEKAAATLAIVQKDGAKAAGDFARTSGGLANQTKILSAQFKDTRDTLGAQLIPVLSGATRLFMENKAVILPVVAVLGVLATTVFAVNAATKVFTAVQTVAKAATVAWTGAQWLLNAALTANPIGLVIVGLAALAAGLVIAYKKSETFRAIVQAAMQGVVTAFQWVVDKGNEIVTFFTGLPGRISSATVGMFDGVKDAFRSAFNWIIDKWNGLDFSIPGVDTNIPGIGKIGGFTLGTPNIPRLALGGIATQPTLAMIGEGRESEAVLPLSKLEALLNRGGSRQGGVTFTGDINIHANTKNQMLRELEQHQRLLNRR